MFFKLLSFYKMNNFVIDLDQRFINWVRSNPKGSTEPFREFDEGNLKHVTHFYFLLYWAQMGFDKTLDNYVRVRFVCEV